MISQTAEYALRAAVYLGGASDTPRTAREISEATHIPTSYLSKVLGSLARARVVDSQRGPRGGFALARRPDQLTVLEIVQAVDDWKLLDGCPLGLPEHKGGRLCGLHRHLAEAQGHMSEAFGRCTLANLLQEPPAASSSSEGCVFPRGPR